MALTVESYYGSWSQIEALAMTLSHQQNMHVFADGRKNMNDIFNNYACSASHMRPELHFQNVWREPWIAFQWLIFSKNIYVIQSLILRGPNWKQI